MTFTFNELVLLGLIFLAGLLLGAILAPSGKRWKRRYEAERDAHVVTRREHDRLIEEYRPGTKVGDLDLRRRENRDRDDFVR